MTAVVLPGCDAGSERMHPLEMKARDLEREKAELVEQLEQCRMRTEQLKAQVRALSALPEENRENFYAIRSVKITGLSNFYDKDEDGVRETLIVYIKPIDQTGDIIKAAGTVHVQLWNLNTPNDQALLGEWQVQPAELQKLWYDTLVAASYRLTFDAALTAEVRAQPLTVKVTFSDYLTGEIYSDQQIIKPKID